MKRFYKTVTVEAADDGWRVVLDGRGILTPAKRQQIVSSPALADAMAAEWAGQGETIDASAFFLRDLADYAIDVVATRRDETIRELLPFAETDTLCYRGDEGEPLHSRQMQVWEPLLTGAERDLGVSFQRVSGVIHCQQPPETLARLTDRIATESPFSIAAIKTLASIAASLVIALKALEPGADIKALFDAASLEEDWQAELWGLDAEAEVLRKRRFATFAAAARFAALARDETAQD